MIVKNKKRKCKSNTPILFKIPKALQDQIKRVPRLSLQTFKDNQPTATDWYNLTFRVKIGVDLAQSVYTDEAYVEMNTVLNTLLEVKDNYLSSGIWDMSPVQIECIEIGLDAIDEMTDDNTRRIQLDAFHSSDKYMKSILVSLNTEIYNRNLKTI